MRIPSDPPEAVKQPKEVAPVTFLHQPDRAAVPEGAIHPSVNTRHIIQQPFHSDQPVEFTKEEEPTESDLDPLLVEVDENALQGSTFEG